MKLRLLPNLRIIVVTIMPVSREYLDYVVDLLSVAGTITARRMFGGAGLYLKGLFFALIADDVLYFKVDDSNRADYVAAGSEPFRPFSSYEMSYYEVPADVLEDEEKLRVWAEKALAAARKGGAGREKKRTLRGNK
jgi:DNA transformation protein